MARKYRSISTAACFIDEESYVSIVELEDLVHDQLSLYWGLETAYVYKDFYRNTWLPNSSTQTTLVELLSDDYLKDNYSVTDGIIYLKETTSCQPNPTLRKICEELDPSVIRSKRIHDPRTTLPCHELIKCPFSTEFMKEIVLNYQITDNAFCPSLNTGKTLPAQCETCRYRNSGFTSTRTGNPKQIHVYDVRMCGHPVQVVFHFNDINCKLRKQRLQSLPGINNRSKYNQVRFSNRLTGAINKALSNRQSHIYISEASGVPLDTIRRWTVDEINWAAKQNAKQLASINFTSKEDYGCSLMESSVKGSPHVFVQRLYHANHALHGHLVTEYATELWSRAVRELSSFLIDGSAPPSAYHVLDFYEFINLCFDFSAALKIKDMPPFVYRLIRNVIIQSEFPDLDPSLQDRDLLASSSPKGLRNLDKLEKLLPKDLILPQESDRPLLSDSIYASLYGDSITPIHPLDPQLGQILQEDAKLLDFAEPDSIARCFLYFHKYSLPVTTDSNGHRHLCLTKNGNIDYRKLVVRGVYLPD